MLSRCAVEIHTLPVNQCFPTCPRSWRNSKPFYRNAEPQKWAAKHLGHAWYIGKRFCKSRCVMLNRIAVEIHTLPVHLDGQGDGVTKACPEQAAADS